MPIFSTRKNNANGPHSIHADGAIHDSPKGGLKPNQVNGSKKTSRWMMCIPLPLWSGM